MSSISETKRRKLTLNEYVEGVRANDKSVLARAITLVESNRPDDVELAGRVLQEILPGNKQSVRIGITGVPGAGKSTFIEALGLFLTEKEHRLAVLAVDPSSSLTKGSILGDKTRMEKLSREPNCFIRPSPTAGALGGVARKTRESIALFEAAGYDVIIVETVGVGQNEISIRSLVDFFLLLMITGSGDELQSIKKGVFELADMIVVNKADGENLARASAMQADLLRALHYLNPYTPGWEVKALICSALKGKGLTEIWTELENFVTLTKRSGTFEHTRRQQNIKWMHDMIGEHVTTKFFSDPRIQKALPDLEDKVSTGQVPVSTAVQSLLNIL